MDGKRVSNTREGSTLQKTQQKTRRSNSGRKIGEESASSGEIKQGSASGSTSGRNIETIIDGCGKSYNRGKSEYILGAIKEREVPWSGRTQKAKITW